MRPCSWLLGICTIPSPGRTSNLHSHCGSWQASGPDTQCTGYPLLLWGPTGHIRWSPHRQLILHSWADLHNLCPPLLPVVYLLDTHCTRNMYLGLEGKRMAEEVGHMVMYDRGDFRFEDKTTLRQWVYVHKRYLIAWEAQWRTGCEVILYYWMKLNKNSWYNSAHSHLLFQVGLDTFYKHRLTGKVLFLNFQFFVVWHYSHVQPPLG